MEFYQNQEYDEAKGYYEKILLERGDNAQAHFGLGASSYQQGDIEVAKEGFQESLEIKDEEIYKVDDSVQLLRHFDNLPKKALAQAC